MRVLRQIPRRQLPPLLHQVAIRSLQSATCDGSAIDRPAFKRNQSSRGGLTLYEVLLAIAIFFPALAVLGQGIATGSRAGVQARLQSQAILRCESALAEVVSGASPMQSSTGMAFPDGAAGWSWDLEVLAGPHLHLLELQVTANYLSESGMNTASYTLTRYVRDPQLYIDAAALEAMEAEAAAAAGTMP